MCVVKQFTLKLAYIENGSLGRMLPPHPWSVFTEQAATVGGLSCLSSNTLPLCPQSTLRDEHARCKQEPHFSTSTISIDNLISYAFIPSWLAVCSLNYGF